MKKLKVGIFGAGRGVDVSRDFRMLDCEIVALCDNIPERLQYGAKRVGEGVTLYDDFDKFIEHPMDACVVANYFHEHTPFAIRLLERGISVYCECIVNGTMAEGVDLIRAAERSNAIFMLAENYPGMCVNQEMHRICQTGKLGHILYAEGEYNHPADPYDTAFVKTYNYCPDHWRNYLPRTYYVTHSLGPLMYSTGALPKRVCAMATFAPRPKDAPSASQVGDRAAVMMTQNDDGSIFRFTGCAAFGAHGNAYRICGTKGQVENLRGMFDKIMLRYNEWETPEGEESQQCYTPAWADNINPEAVKTSGHAGGDFVIARIFVNCVKEQKQPPFPFDVHSAVAMSSVAILAHRSMLEGGTPYDIPDFHNEEERAKWEHDTISPFPKADGSVDIPCCSHTDYKPTEAQLRAYLELLK